ncbi:MAG TPA: alpha/beta hydrolase [Geminicoccaceae bacterium]|nr:alpha/beta hydrolase [Geminicoccus sp.]HMU49699.1 alpha/beta hydrolase [Geminicoccaceae bacterium]
MAELDPDMAEAMSIEAARTAAMPPPRDLAEERRRGIEGAAFWNEGVPEMAVQGRRVGGVAVDLYQPNGQEDAPTLLYVHGGGWAVGSVGQNEPAIRGLAQGSGWNVAAPTYRLAPEHPFPAGLEDCLTVAGWLAASGRPWAVAGTSAGANLAIATALARRHMPGPSALVLFYGVFGADLDTGSYTAFGDGRYGLSRERMANFFEMYDPAGARTRDPLITPLLGDLAGLPPTWLLAAGLDVLRDDTLAMRERMQAAGVDVRLRVEPGCTHGFINRGRIVRAARESLDDAAAFLRQQIGEPA